MFIETFLNISFSYHFFGYFCVVIKNYKSYVNEVLRELQKQGDGVYDNITREQISEVLAILNKNIAILIKKRKAIYLTNFMSIYPNPKKIALDAMFKKIKENSRHMENKIFFENYLKS